MVKRRLLLVAIANVVILANVLAATQSPIKNNENNNPKRINSPAEIISRRLRDANNNDRHDHQEQRRGADDHAIKDVDMDSMVDPDLKIIGGVLATTERYPYLASLTYFGTSICGGSLVAKDMILTAAHCAGYASAIELGRTDRSVPFNANKDNFERIEVAYEIKHPGWDVTTVHNDFMLMKLVGDAKRDTLIKLNTNPNIPFNPKEQLTIMGWGDTNADPDVNTPGVELLQAQLEYVTQDVCKLKEGEIEGGGYVKYESRLTDNMLCGMDEEGVVDEDTCVGDSGGPLVITPENSNYGDTEDLQVGLVSWGIGCANPTFPGVYARISAQYQWIREGVCRHSNSAPESFDCASLGQDDSDTDTGPILEEDPSDGKSYVVLEVSLDDRPQEFSWVVSTLTSPGQPSQMVSSLPPGFYTGYPNYTFHHKLQVNPDSFYRISLRDTFGDGLSGYAAVYRSSIPILSNLILYESGFYDKDSTDLNKVDHAFYTGKDPIHYFTLRIKFDKFPKDTWWKLESTTDNVIMAQRPPGWYNERFELMTITEKIPVFGPRPDLFMPPEYRFTIGDSYPCDNDPTKTCGDGICCNYGQGKYELFAGPVEDNLLLTSGGKYQLVESVTVKPPDSFSVA